MRNEGKRGYSPSLFPLFSTLWKKTHDFLIRHCSRPSLNPLCHSNTCVLDRVDSPKYFCNIFNDSVAVIPLETQNFKQTRCSIFFSIVKIARETSRRKLMAAKHTLMDVPAHTSHDCQRRCYQPRQKTFYHFGLRAWFDWTRPGQIWWDGIYIYGRKFSTTKIKYISKILKTIISIVPEIIYPKILFLQTFVFRTM